jgi:UDP-N-acetylmuramoyl-tripeptide--D-alanyl-D-alanine ligase
VFTVSELITITSAGVVAPGKAVRVSGISTDSRTISAGQAFLAISGENFDGHDFIAAAAEKQASCIVIARGKMRSNAAVQLVRQSGCWLLEVDDTLRALGALAGFHRRRFAIPVIAVSGSNGKTTTKDMACAVLSRKFAVHKTAGTRNNHIGLPQTLLGLNSGHQACVVELGTNHFGEIARIAQIAEPTMGILTSIGPSHLEYFKSLSGVFKEKSSLLAYLSSPGIAIVNSDDPYLNRLTPAKKHGSPVFSFSCLKKADFRARRIVQRNGCVRFSVRKNAVITIATPGAQHVYNALAAIACARILGVAYADIKAALAGFTFPSGRLTLRTVRDVRFIDDTYNASPASFQQALSALAGFKIKGRKILVMGDMLELGAHSRRFHARTGSTAAEVCDTLITVGELSCAAGKAARQAGLDAAHVFSCSSAAEARQVLMERIAPGSDDVILVKGSRAMKMEEVLAI